MVKNLRHLDFNLLKAMDILLEEGSVTRAAGTPVYYPTCHEQHFGTLT